MIIEGVASHNRLVVQTSYDELPIMRSLPIRKWDRKTDRWLVPAIPANLGILRRHNVVSPFEFAKRDIHTVPDASFVFKTAPMPQQMGALLAMQDMPAFGLFMDPGTGKTKILIDDAVAAFRRGEIDGVLLICPNSIKPNWVEELEKHSGEPFMAHEHEPDKSSRFATFQRAHFPGLKWLIMGVESLSSKSGVTVATHFLLGGKKELAVDESSRIKTHDANRTKAIVQLAKRAVRTRIATGTPATQGPQNVWSQFETLDPGILDLDYYPFRATFCIMGGYKAKQIVAAKNEDILLDLIAPYVFQARKEDCLNLPPKIHQRRFCTPSAEQMRLYNDLLVTGSLETPNGIMDFDTALVRDLRLHQLTGGFIATQECMQSLAALLAKAQDDPEALRIALDNAPLRTWYRAEPIPGPNPKIEELLNFVNELPAHAKVIVWSRYRPEIAAIAEALRPLGGTVQFHGGIGKDERTLARQKFQTDPGTRFFLGQIQTGGIGITLTAAGYAVFFSSDWSAENRIQAEDRNHRIGSEIHDGCVYVDLLLDGRYIDTRVLNAVQSGVDYHHGMMDDLKIRLEKNSLTVTGTEPTLQS